MRHHTKIWKLATGAVAASLMLSACGGGGEGDAPTTAPAAEGDAPAESSPIVYQFDEARVDDSDDQQPFTSSDSEVVVQLSEELKGALPEGAAVAVDHFTVSAKAFGTGICRVDVDIAYTDGGLEFVQQPQRDPANGGDPYDESPHWFALKALTGERLEEGGVVDSVPTDDEIGKDASYLTEDYSHATVVDDCSEDVDDSVVELTFPYSAGGPESQFEVQAFAEVEVAVMSGGQSGSEGTTLVITGDTDAEVRANGQWAPPED